MNSKKISFTAVCIALCLLPIFYNSYRFDLPVGYAGMFASFGEQLSAENFSLPEYGLGGVPYVYPPLGFYLQAIFLKLGISTWFYLRWLVPCFSLAALVVFSVIYDRLFHSKMWAGLAALLIASSPYLVESHAWAAGMVRGLAFLNFMLAFGIFLHLKPDSNWKLPTLAGIFSGLTILSHLGYTFFLALWMGIWFLFNLKNWRQVLIMGAAAIITIAPWLIAVLARHPADVFFNALQAHGTLSIVSALQDLSQLRILLWVGMSKMLEIPLLAWAALAGAVYHIYQRRYQLPIMLAATLLFSLESRRFVIVLGVLLTVSSLQSITALFENKKNLQRFTTLMAAFIILALYSSGMQLVAAMKPSLTQALIDAGKFLNTKSSPEDGYLLIGGYGETEWFPFLSQRVPIFAHWAREWQGDLGEQGGLSADLFSCAQQGDLDCVSQVIQRSQKDPQYLVVMKRKFYSLSDALSASYEWRRIYTNSEYQVWEKRVRE